MKIGYLDERTIKDLIRNRSGAVRETLTGSRYRSLKGADSTRFTGHIYLENLNPNLGWKIDEEEKQEEDLSLEEVKLQQPKQYFDQEATILKTTDLDRIWRSVSSMNSEWENQDHLFEPLQIQHPSPWEAFAPSSPTENTTDETT